MPVETQPALPASVPDRLTRFAHLAARVIPDALSTSIGLLVFVFALALVLGNTPQAAFDAYYRGLWMLLPFTMQMTLIIVLSASLGEAPSFRRLIAWLSKWPHSRTQVLGSVILATAWPQPSTPRVTPRLR